MLKILLNINNCILCSVCFLDEDLPTFPVELDYLKGVKERVILATSIDKQEHQ